MLKGKTAIVTGGTRGIGLAIVRTYLQNGAKVALLGSREETVQKALAELHAENPDWEVEGYWTSLSDLNALTELFQDLNKKWGHVDILVNNAGMMARQSLYEYEEDDFRKIIDLNLSSVFRCIKAVAPIMRDQHEGVILNTSSMVSLYGQKSGVGYPATKTAINGMTRSLARELSPDGIRVNAVAPGITRTDMVKSLPEDMVARISAQIPLGRVAEAQDVANAFLFLASDLASYVTGCILNVDGAAMI